jgi:glucokinase
VASPYSLPSSNTYNGGAGYGIRVSACEWHVPSVQEMATDPYAVAIDVGGTKALVALVRATGEILGRVTLPTHESESLDDGPTLASASPAHRLVERIATAAGSMVRRIGVSPAGTGVATTGHVDASSGTVLHSGLVPGWSGFPLQSQMAAALSRHGVERQSVVVDNDGHAMALAEGRLGAARGHRHAICVAVGTGVGGGFLVDGTLYRGHRGLAGLVGHSTISMRGRVCQCGKRGCLEAYAAGPRIVDEYRRLARLQEGRARLPRGITLPEVCRLADLGDDVASMAIRRGGEYLGVGLASLANVLNPSIIVIGGGVLGAGPRWFDAARDSVMGRVRHTVAVGLDVVPATLGSDAVVIGAGLMGLAT